ncbi:AMP-binding protein [Tistrella bauzanensis]|uniref:AMP-binding protein n=1 Tax=Tistrella TaxID=171436 RepID=UPI0031F6DEB2
MRAIDPFFRGLSLAPDRPALIDAQAPDQPVSYAALADMVEALAGWLAGVAMAGGGGAPGRVAVLSPNAAGAFAVVLACLRAGVTWVPINARNALDENLFIMNQAKVSVLAVADAFAFDLPRILAAVPGITAVLMLGHAPPPAGEGGLVVAVAEGVLADPPPPAPDPVDDPDRVSSVLSTGGTTGRPKGVVWTDRMWEALTLSIWAHMPMTDGAPPVHLVAAPMTHAAGVIAVPLLAGGATTVILPRADPQAIMAAIARHRVTHLFLPPTVIYMILADAEARRHDTSSLRYLIYSAAPMAPDKLADAMALFGPVLVQGYGQAEIPLMGTFMGAAEHAAALASGNRARLMSAGRPGLASAVSIRDDAGRPVPVGETGEICFRGSLVTPGYDGRPDLTAEHRFGDWHRTGDLGFIDAEGYVSIVDRARDMIISGGFNVYSAEVERAILAHPGIRDCAVIGVPHDIWGEAVTAIIEPVSGTGVDLDALSAQLRAELGGVKAPKAIEIWPELPRSPVGKVLKRQIRDTHWKDRLRKI